MARPRSTEGKSHVLGLDSGASFKTITTEKIKVVSEEEI